MPIDDSDKQWLREQFTAIHDRVNDIEKRLAKLERDFAEYIRLEQRRSGIGR